VKARRTDSPAAAPPLPHCYWVLPGELLAGEHPAAAGAEATPTRLRRLLDAGIDSFIDLTQPEELGAYAAELPDGVGYLRKPLPDHSIPREPIEMAEILESIAAQLAAGRRIYLHCRAGIGRTGMVVGCLLVERGLTGDAAMSELNRLWQQNPRALDWLSVPETDEQSDYVRRWGRDGAAEADPLLSPATLRAAQGLRERFQGALLGLALGDAIAAATQYRRTERLAPVGDLLGGGPFDLPRGGWSDDTAMALCLAESLIECQRFDARDQVLRYRRWQQEGHLSATGRCLGITADTARALGRAQFRRQAFSGSHDPEALAPEPLSRVAPVVMFFFGDAATASKQAAQAARTTSQAPAVLGACRVLADALHAALSGEPKSAILGRSVPESAPAAAGATPGATAPAALAAAFEAFSGTGNFRDAVLAAANLGGNSDVMAAVCGALAGAHYTKSAIPTLWRNSLMKKELIEGMADRLLAHALLTLG